MRDPYIVGFELLSIDLKSASLADLAALTYACSSTLDSIEEEVMLRGVERE